MDDSTKLRPLKKFRVRVAVMDAEHNELATANLTGEVEPADTPQVSIMVQEEIVQVPNHDDQSGQEGDVPERKGAAGNGTGSHDERDDEADQTETVAVTSRDEEEAVDEGIDADIADLGDIMESVMGRQWFQLFVDRQVDSDMVRKRWGAAALEVFQVNRDMMELMEAVEQDKGKSAAERMRAGSQHEGELVVRNMDRDDGSSESSGAKVFPRREVVAGRRGPDTATEDVAREKDNTEDGNDGDVVADNEGDNMENRDESSGHAAAAEGEAREEQGPENSTNQQELLNTQLEEMDVEEAGTIAAAGASNATAGSGTSTATGSTEGLGDGSFGDGKVQSDLEGWLHRGD